MAVNIKSPQFHDKFQKIYIQFVKVTKNEAFFQKKDEINLNPLEINLYNIIDLKKRTLDLLKVKEKEKRIIPNLLKEFFVDPWEIATRFIRAFIKWLIFFLTHCLLSDEEIDEILRNLAFYQWLRGLNLSYFIFINYKKLMQFFLTPFFIYAFNFLNNFNDIFYRKKLYIFTSLFLKYIMLITPSNALLKIKALIVLLLCLGPQLTDKFKNIREIIDEGPKDSIYLKRAIKKMIEILFGDNAKKKSDKFFQTLIKLIVNCTSDVEKPSITIQFLARKLMRKSSFIETIKNYIFYNHIHQIRKVNIWYLQNLISWGILFFLFKNKFKARLNLIVENSKNVIKNLRDTINEIFYETESDQSFKNLLQSFKNLLKQLFALISLYFGLYLIARIVEPLWIIPEIIYDMGFNAECLKRYGKEVCDAYADMIVDWYFMLFGPNMPSLTRSLLLSFSIPITENIKNIMIRMVMSLTTDTKYGFLDYYNKRMPYPPNATITYLRTFLHFHRYYMHRVVNKWVHTYYRFAHVLTERQKEEIKKYIAELERIYEVMHVFANLYCANAIGNFYRNLEKLINFYGVHVDQRILFFLKKKFY